jgi:hypothetical protein
MSTSFQASNVEEQVAYSHAFNTVAITDAHTWLDKKYEQMFAAPFYEGTHRTLPAYPDIAKAIQVNYELDDIYPTDERAVSYSIAYFSVKHLGAGQFYLMTPKDKNDQSFVGSKTYRLHLPANVPVKLYWSVTAYDRETHALIKNMKYASRASTTPGLQKNTDGSVDLYFGAKAPEGKESNWIPTDAQRQLNCWLAFMVPKRLSLIRPGKWGM